MSTTIKDFSQLAPARLTTVSATAVGIIQFEEQSDEPRFVRYPAERKAPVKRKKLHLTELELNPAQQSMYNRVSKGLAAYSPVQLAAMSVRDQQRVDRDHKRYKHLVHKLRQQAMPETKLIRAIWPQLEIGQRYADVDVDVRLLDSRRRLGITRDAIIAVLIEHGVLPTSFHDLQPEGLSGE